MPDNEMTIQVQVCFAGPESTFLEDLSLVPGATLEQAIYQSGVLAAVPEIDLGTCKTGIYGKIKPLDTILRERDRVEIYRALIADPKDARRKRVLKKDKAR